jgi:Ca2+-binding EF-hand superfamily protein
VLTALQTKKLEHLFHLHDENKNGFVERVDFERLVERFEARRAGPPDPELRKLWMAQWQAIAAGEHPRGSGQVPLESWLALWNAVLQASFEDRVLSLVEHLFRGMDTDGDGEITSNEYRTWFEILGIDRAQSDEVFQRCDLDGDGHITKSEWLLLVEDFFFSDDPSAVGNDIFGKI